MKLVIVESPAKAQTINKYLGNDYKVIASVGHIRDLPSKDGAVLPDDNFKMSWEMHKDKEKVVKEIIGELKSADRLILATDPDREGEAISWHLKEILDSKKTILGKPVERVVFNEITKNAVLDAMKKPRKINSELVEAYLARRALDHLIGFSISPILWRKLPGSKSAGRVQSVALKLICEREIEIEKFNIEEYWSISSIFLNNNNENFLARLFILDSKKLAKMDIKNEDEANNALDKVRKSSFNITKIVSKRVKRNPLAPFTTSTLQQEASNKLGFGASRTMRIAQKLYEGVNIGSETTGLITYMRTDGVQLSSQAIEELREEIINRHGKDYIPQIPRVYKSRAANAQEAHEAIRPTSITRDPEDMSQYLDTEQLKLYELIWKRTISSQMQSAELDETSADISNKDMSIVFRANGSQVSFPGFFIYRDREDDKILPKLLENDKVDLQKADGEQHFTQPPPRYTDASLIKKMEELGIGRPSTYAATITTVQKRGYVDKDSRDGKERVSKLIYLKNGKLTKEEVKSNFGAEKNKLFPTDVGVVVTDFLLKNFENIMQYSFTASVEDEFDQIAAGKKAWNDMIAAFYSKFHNQVEKVSETEGKSLGQRNLGVDAKTGNNLYARIGPFGPMIQLGEKSENENDPKPKYASLLKGQTIQTITFEEAMKLFDLPRTVGEFEDEEIVAAIGRFGPYLRYKGKFTSIKKTDNEDPLTISLERSIELIKAKIQADKERIVANFNGNPLVQVLNGRYGVFIQISPDKGKKINVKIPKDLDPKKLSREDCLDLMENQKKK